MSAAQVAPQLKQLLSIALQLTLQAARLEPERSVPATLLAGAKGLALLSVVRLGAGWSCTAGTGNYSRQLQSRCTIPYILHVAA